MVIWKLRQGADKRIRGGHPWVFSNELSSSPKGIGLGTFIELQDNRGNFLARGYGNPHSLISFRALSFNPEVREPMAFPFLSQRLLQSWQVRKNAGFRGSFRMSFGEADFLPGLVLDYYLVEQNGKKAQVFAAQLVTAGLDKALQDAEGFFKLLVDEAVKAKLTDLTWEQTAVVIRNDVNVRKLEGLEVQEPRTIKTVVGLDLTKVDILLNSASDDGVIRMQCDLAEGQKTGFFLDQTQNIFQAVQIFRNWAKTHPELKSKPIKVLDLCCYVGHWATQITRALKSEGFDVEVHLGDVSEPALNFAKLNAEREGAQVTVHKVDVLEGLDKFESRSFDIIIADPPAFIKAKKDIPKGQHAYLKMNTQAFRIIKPQRFVVSCSCSGLLVEEDFKEAIRKAIQRNGWQARNLTRGGHAADHPTILQFPEGFYLKMFTHFVEA
ncbi:class I SAM-dependent rRNA methyltransferase [Bdellovibrio sp. HCB337]|uniref:class I SAM-dependent rRNA methyltransferase n=1 Tax=Bdellovibrio sp. HCB337 TaxID=3394358 RepID=UPI0039A4AEED